MTLQTLKRNLVAARDEKWLVQIKPLRKSDSTQTRKIATRTFDAYQSCILDLIIHKLANAQLSLMTHHWIASVLLPASVIIYNKIDEPSADTPCPRLRKNEKTEIKEGLMNTGESKLWFLTNNRPTNTASINYYENLWKYRTRTLASSTQRSIDLTWHLNINVRFVVLRIVQNQRQRNLLKCEFMQYSNRMLLILST